MPMRVKIEDCPDCKATFAEFCSARCRRNYMARIRYWKNKIGMKEDD